MKIFDLMILKKHVLLIFLILLFFKNKIYFLNYFILLNWKIEHFLMS